MALSPGEQALVAKGQTVTSSFIPAESRARINAAISQQDIVSRVNQIQQAGGGDTAATRAQIAQEAQQYGVTPEQLGNALNFSGSEIRSMAQEAGAPFSTPTGMLTSGQTGTPVADIPSMPTLDSTTVLQPDSEGLIQQIYESELGRSLGSTEADQGALDYWTSRLQSGASAEQVRREIEGSPEGMVYDTYTGLLGRDPDEAGREYWVNQLTAGDLTPQQVQQNFLQSEEFLGDIASVKELNPLDLINTSVSTGSISSLGTLFYQARQDNTEIPASLIEEIGYSRSPDTTTAYNYAVGGQAYAEGLEALDRAVQLGDTDKAQELRNALADEQNFYNYYINNIAENEGQAHGNLRKETATGDTIFGIGDPKGGLKGSLERGIVRLGDSIGDVVDNPYVQAAVSFAYPPAGAVLNAYATLDSGENLSPAQVAAALAGASELSGLEGGNLLKALPQGVQDFVQSAQDFADGFEGRAVAALKQAFPNVDTEKLAQYEDSFKTFLAGGEDVIRNVVGDENIEYISNNLAEFEDLIRGQFGSQQEQLDAVAAALAAERQPRFVAQRSSQGPVARPRLTKYEDSDVLAIMNQPSAVRPLTPRQQTS